MFVEENPHWPLYWDTSWLNRNALNEALGDVISNTGECFEARTPGASVAANFVIWWRRASSAQDGRTGSRTLGHGAERQEH